MFLIMKENIKVSNKGRVKSLKEHVKHNFEL
ncbi:hypothetical protein CoNPh17_CDS0176 [Staphylococcus phage S-CoN_Ph17]|nr:hypothetical protein CoNPh17_CDS0176 [Staphylococcus phage S-CoN_Ph17]